MRTAARCWRIWVACIEPVAPFSIVHKSITPQAVALTREYITTPEFFWGAAGALHVHKIDSAIRFAGGPNADAIAVAEDAMAVARLRLTHAAPPVYISNIGSSGSHWLESMLCRAPSLIKCGEVYLPRSILVQLRSATAADAEYFLHAVYALHSRKLGSQLIRGSFINSAHHSNISLFSSLTPGSKIMLLVRDPVDIVMSRTFRKQEYRDRVAPGIDDLDYLQKNCDLVNRFYAMAFKQKVDLIIKYEELLQDTEGVLRYILTSIGADMTQDVLARAIKVTRADSIKSSVSSGGTAPTNLYLGDREPTNSLFTSLAKKRLAKVRQKLGYTNTRQLSGTASV
jgi:Sulfotransferase family